MNVFHFARALLGSLSLAACALAPNLSQLRSNIPPDLSFVGKDGLTLFEQRFARVKEALPAGEMIYYAGGPDDTGEYFYLTQYVLAPITVTRTPGPRTIIYLTPTIRSPLDAEATAEVSRQEYPDGTVMLDFHNGIKLAKRPAP